MCSLQKGFTLIEMLVVIAIISILIGIGVNTFTIAQKKARDVRRKADIRSIQTALELYKQDTGVYPPSVGDWVKSTTDSWIPGLVPNYIPKVPRDPSANDTDPWVDGGNRYAYGYTSSDGQKYNLVAQLENRYDPDRCELKNYKRSWDSGITTISWCPEYSKYLYSGGNY